MSTQQAVSVAEIPPAAEQRERERIGILDRYELVEPWDRESRLFARKRPDVGTLWVAQFADDELQIVELAREDLDAMTRENRGVLERHEGAWERCLSTGPPLSGWDGASTEIRVEQERHRMGHEVVLTVVDAAELLAAFDLDD